MLPVLHKAWIQDGRQAPDRQNLGLCDGGSDGRCQWEDSVGWDCAAVLKPQSRQGLPREKKQQVIPGRQRHRSRNKYCEGRSRAELRFG